MSLIYIYYATLKKFYSPPLLLSPQIFYMKKIRTKKDCWEEIARSEQVMMVCHLILLAYNMHRRDLFFWRDSSEDTRLLRDTIPVVVIIISCSLHTTITRPLRIHVRFLQAIGNFENTYVYYF